jgi:outer membrane receptor protein involved in Fe transport
VFSPAFAPGLRMSVDYYKINIKDVVGNLSAQQTIDQCRLGNQQTCALITRGANNLITTIAGTNINASALRTSGVDTEVQYRFPVEAVLPAGGDVTLRMLATYTQYRITTIAGVDTDIAGQNYGGIPTWKINTSAAYANGPLVLRATVRFISDGKYQKQLQEGVQIEENNLKGATYVDLSASYQVSRRVQLYGAVNNLFDVDPVLSPSPLVEVGYSGGGNYDLIGQWFAAGVRFTF